MRLGPQAGPVRCCLAGPGPQASVLVPGQTGCTSVVPEFRSSVPLQPGTHLSGQLSGPFLSLLGPHHVPLPAWAFARLTGCLGSRTRPYKGPHRFPLSLRAALPQPDRAFLPDCIPGGPTGVGEPSGGRLGRLRGWGSHLLPRGRPIWTLRLVWPRVRSSGRAPPSPSQLGWPGRAPEALRGLTERRAAAGGGRERGAQFRPVCLTAIKAAVLQLPPPGRLASPGSPPVL